MSTYTGKTPDGWFTPVDYDVVPCAMVDTPEGIDVVIPLTLSEYGRATSVLVNSVIPSRSAVRGITATDAYQCIVVASPCGHDECAMTIELPLN